MNLDLAFSLWIYNFYFLSDIAQVLSGRLFSGFLVILIGLYFLKIKKFKTFIFICLITGFGDFLGNMLKDIFSQPRPCFSEFEFFPEIEQCGEDLTGLPSNHALNFFTFSTLLHLTLKNRIISFIYIMSSIMVALSRVILIKHFLSQVIIGSVIGITLAIISYKVFKKWIKI